MARPTISAERSRHIRRRSVLRRDHGGVAGARNVAIRAATGDFVVALDADNRLLPGYVDAVTELAVVRPDLDILTTDAFLELDGDIYGRYYRGKARFVIDDQRRGIIHQHFVYANAGFRRERCWQSAATTSSTTRSTVPRYRSPPAAHPGGFEGRSRRRAPRGLSHPQAEPQCQQAALLRGGTVVLERAASHPSLTTDELRYLSVSSHGFEGR